MFINDLTELVCPFVGDLTWSLDNLFANIPMKGLSHKTDNKMSQNCSITHRYMVHDTFCSMLGEPVEGQLPM